MVDNSCYACAVVNSRDLMVQDDDKDVRRDMLDRGCREDGGRCADGVRCNRSGVGLWHEQGGE